MTERAAVGAVLTLACLLAATPVSAQVYADAPTPLFPGPGAVQAPVEAAPPAAPAPSGITIDGLADVDPEAVGVLAAPAPEPWDRDLGPQVWFSLDRVATLARLRALPAASAAPVARGISRQLLLSAAAPMGTAGAPPTPGVLSATRLDLLLQAGNAEDARRLAAVIPPRIDTEAVALAAVRADWLAGDVAAACAKVESGLARFDATIWTAQDAVCAALAKDAARAQLAVGLLAELDAIDADFQPVADRINGRGSAKLAAIPESMDVFEVAALRRLGVDLPPAPPLAQRPWLARLAMPAEGPVTEDHLVTMEYGLRHGAVPAAEAASVYARFKVSADDMTKAQALETPATGPRGRALYWQALAAATTPEAGVLLLDRMLAAARTDREAWATTAPLLASRLAAMRDVAAAVRISGDAARVALWTGDWTTARAWMQRISSDAMTADEAKRIAAELAPLFHIVNAPADAQSRAAVAPPPIAPWLAAETARGLTPEQLARVRDRLFGLYRVFGLPLAAEDWQAALAAPGAAEGLSAPPLLLAAADDAATRGAKGLALSLVAQALDAGGDAAPVSAPTVEGAVAVLLKAMSVDWAKRAAVESLIAAGY